MPKHQQNIEHEVEQAERESVGTVLRRLRSEAHLTQEQLGEELSYSRPTITNAERGQTSRPILDAYIARFPEAEDAVRQAAPSVYSHDVDDFDAVILRRSTKASALDGQWWALWETTADGEEVINTEELQINHRRSGVLQISNREPSEENPKGGYLWIATCRLFDARYIMGTYVARESAVRSKGTIYMVLHNSGQFIEGQWLGCNYDGDWARGLTIFARDKSRLPELLKLHRRRLPHMPYKGEANGLA